MKVPNQKDKVSKTFQVTFYSAQQIENILEHFFHLPLRHQNFGETIDNRPTIQQISDVIKLCKNV